MIGELDDPPGELIEVSWRKPRAQLLDDLNSVPGERDFRRVGGWLFAALREAGPPTAPQLRAFLRQAFYIVAAAQLGTEIYDELDHIDDDLALCACGELVSMEVCLAGFNDFLERHASTAPFSGGLQ